MAKTKRKRKKRHDSLVLQLMILVAVVLVVFEGASGVVTMITHRSSMKSTTVTDSTAAAAVQDGTCRPRHPRQLPHKTEIRYLPGCLP